MSQLAPVTHIIPVTVILRKRVLPVPGQLMIRKGQKVAPTDVLAETILTPEHILLDIARLLGVSPRKADKYIQKKAGDQVDENDIIAGPIGMLGQRVVRASRPGKVVLAGSGQVLIEMEGRPHPLKAGLSGTVSELIDDQGADVETAGALIQGVWGNGRIDFGMLTILCRSADDPLTPDRLDVSQRGTIILGGYCNDETLFTAAADIPIRGIILASMDSSLVATAVKMPYPILLIEGFGKIPMNTMAYKLLTTNERREVAINAEIWNRYEGMRPEITIALPTAGQVTLPLEAIDFAAGKIVRVTTAPYRGKIGSVVSLQPGLVEVASGVKTQAANVRLESGEDIVMPLANLEILE